MSLYRCHHCKAPIESGPVIRMGRTWHLKCLENLE